MHTFIQLSNLMEREVAPGFFGKMIHTEQVTVAHFRIVRGSVLPLHQHVHEQVTNVLAGELELTIDGVTRICRAGESVVIPSNVPHSGRALTDCQVIDIFCPARQDYQ